MAHQRHYAGAGCEVSAREGHGTCLRLASRLRRRLSALVLHWPQLSSCRHSPFRRWHVHVPHRNGWLVAEESENFMLFHSVICLKHDDRTEYVPLVAKPEHIFDSGHAPSDMNFGCKWSMRNLLNGSKAHIGRWKKGKRERCTSQPHKTPSEIVLLALFCKHSSAARGDLQRLAAKDTLHGGRRAEKGCR